MQENDVVGFVLILSILFVFAGIVVGIYVLQRMASTLIPMLKDKKI